MPPLLSEAATTVQPSSSWRRRAAWYPPFPSPCPATVAPLGFSLIRLHASRTAYMRPREVASSRPREPPIAMGLPVTAPGAADPAFIEIVSMIHAIVWLSVYPSGAGGA